MHGIGPGDLRRSDNGGDVEVASRIGSAGPMQIASSASRVCKRVGVDLAVDRDGA